MAVGWNFQAQYAVPQNISFLQQYPPTYGKKRDIHPEYPSDRRVVYDALEGILDG